MGTELAKMDDEELFAGCGPAMRALNERQRQFVMALMINGYNAADAAARAGYQGTPTVLAITGARLRKQPSVVAAMQEEALTRLNGDALMATGVLSEIAANKNLKAEVRMKAADKILDRLPAFVVEKKQKIVVEHKGPTGLKEQIEELLRLCQVAGRAPRAVMGDEYYKKAVEFGLVVDAEFTEVPAQDFTGLEDVL